MLCENASIADNQQERVPKDPHNLRYYLAGFTDGDGCFSVTIHRSKYRKIGWNINPLFQVYQHKTNPFVLNLLKDEFGVGYISNKGGNPLCSVYCVDRISDLIDVIIPFYREYKLIGKKYVDFCTFALIVEGIANKKHLNPQGFVELAKHAFSMNTKGKGRKYTLDEIIRGVMEQSSETKRQTVQLALCR